MNLFCIFGTFSDLFAKSFYFETIPIWGVTQKVLQYYFDFFEIFSDLCAKIPFLECSQFGQV